jgi:hypothetical protein
MWSFLVRGLGFVHLPTQPKCSVFGHYFFAILYYTFALFAPPCDPPTNSYNLHKSLSTFPTSSPLFHEDSNTIQGNYKEKCHNVIVFIRYLRSK